MGLQQEWRRRLVLAAVGGCRCLGEAKVEEEVVVMLRVVAVCLMEWGREGTRVSCWAFRG